MLSESEQQAVIAVASILYVSGCSLTSALWLRLCPTLFNFINADLIDELNGSDSLEQGELSHKKLLKYSNDPVFAKNVVDVLLKLVDNSSDPCLVLSSDGTVDRFNRPFAEYFEYASPKELKNFGINDIFANPNDAWDCVLTFANGLEYNKNVKLKSKSGNTIFAKLRAYPLIATSPKFLGGIIQIDQSENLRDVEAFLHFIGQIGSAGFATWDWETGGVKWYMNRAMAKNLPSSRDAFINKKVYREDRPFFRKAIYDAAMSDAVDYEARVRVIAPCGQLRWWFIQGLIVRDSNGKPIKFLEIILDVTDRHELEQTTVEKDLLLRSLVWYSSEMMCLVGRDTVLYYVAPKYQGSLGYSSQELEGHPYAYFAYEPHLWILDKGFRTLCEDPQSLVIMQFQYKHKTRGHTWLKSVAWNAFDTLGYIVVNSRDFSLDDHVEMDKLQPFIKVEKHTEFRL